MLVVNGLASFRIAAPRPGYRFRFHGLSGLVSFTVAPIT